MSLCCTRGLTRYLQKYSCSHSLYLIVTSFAFHFSWIFTCILFLFFLNKKPCGHCLFFPQWLSALLYLTTVLSAVVRCIYNFCSMYFNSIITIKKDFWLDPSQYLFTQFQLYFWSWTFIGMYCPCAETSTHTEKAIIPTSHICVTQTHLQRQLNLKLQNTKISENINTSV